MFENLGDHPSKLTVLMSHELAYKSSRSVRTLPYRISRTPRIVIDSEAAFCSNDASGDVAMLIYWKFVAEG